MSETYATIDAEIAGLSRRPADIGKPRILSAIVVETVPRVQLYAGRVRNVLAAGLVTGRINGFDSEMLPIDRLPGWFSGRSLPILDEVAGGRESYVTQRGLSPFTIQEWLEMLDPEFRQWRWWDITADGPRVAMIWIDAGGEVVFNCEELYWLLYSCGACSAIGPLLLPLAAWRFKDSTGFQGVVR